MLRRRNPDDIMPIVCLEAICDNSLKSLRTWRHVEHGWSASGAPGRPVERLDVNSDRPTWNAENLVGMLERLNKVQPQDDHRKKPLNPQRLDQIQPPRDEHDTVVREVSASGAQLGTQVDAEMLHVQGHCVRVSIT